MEEQVDLNQKMPQGKPEVEKKSEDIRPGKKMSKGKIIGWIIVLVVVWIVAVQILAAERYDMQVQVKEEENVMGINPLGDSLDFGDLSRNLGATRFVSMTNESGNDRYVIVWKRGEISGMVEVSQSNFTLESGEEVKLDFAIQIPPSAEFRYYYGKVMIFKWPKWF